MFARTQALLIAPSVSACRAEHTPATDAPNPAVTVFQFDGGLHEGPLALNAFTRADFEALLGRERASLIGECGVVAPDRDYVHVRALGNGSLIARSRNPAGHPAINCAAYEISDWKVPRAQKASEFWVLLELP